MLHVPLTLLKQLPYIFYHVLTRLCMSRSGHAQLQQKKKQYPCTPTKCHLPGVVRRGGLRAVPSLRFCTYN
jgi:hypothetical protein